MSPNMLIQLTHLQIERLRKVAAKGDDGLPVAKHKMSRFITLLMARFVERGPLPKRNFGGRLTSRQRVHITPLGWVFLAKSNAQDRQK